jgi:ketosteroid isomerase-like protein
VNDETSSPNDAAVSPAASAKTPPTKRQFEDLIAEFGKGWEKGDADRLIAVFTEDAVFSSMPFDRPARGRAGIKDYWKSVPREQAEITFRSGEVFVAGPWFAVEIRCTFRRRRTGEWIDLRGALFCETHDGKISEMRMYWHRQSGQ